MQGFRHDRPDRYKVALSFGVPFTVGAALFFASAAMLGAGLGVAHLPPSWRLGVGGTGLLALAALDGVSIKRGTYCPLGWRRQTPRALLHTESVPVVAAVWGFDTGLAFTTFRVTAATWATLLLAVLGLAPAWVGLGYALGFVGPFLVLLWVHRVGRSARVSGGSDPGLGTMLDQRHRLQALSATTLAVVGGALMASVGPLARVVVGP